MLTTTVVDYATALNRDSQTGYRRLRGLPYQSGPAGVHQIDLARALPTIRSKELKLLPALFESATHVNAPLPADAELLVDALEAWMQPDARTRLKNVRRAYSEHIAFATESSLLCRETERLRRLLILDDQLIRYVLTNDQTAFPSNFRRFALEFALTHTPQKEYA